jgi:hypothetical protein
MKGTQSKVLYSVIDQCVKAHDSYFYSAFW